MIWSIVVVWLSAMLFISIPAYRAASRAASAKAHERARHAIALADSLSSLAGDDYLRRSAVDQWLLEHPSPARALLRKAEVARLRDPDVRDRYLRGADVLRDVDRWVAARNEDYVEHRSQELEAWFDARLPQPLTDEQRRAVVTDEDCNLVVAGAGSGKTSTLVAKVVYLTEQRGIDPSEILVLAFNKTVQQEISERLSRLGVPAPEVSTFHAKGYEILSHWQGKKPAISALAEDRQALRRLVDTEFKSRMRTRPFRKRFSRWWVDRRVEEVDLAPGSSPDDRLRKERSLGLITLNGTRVASQAEVKVGDWLTLNDIPWTYEPRYPHAPPSVKRRDYTPDFYLNTHDVWLEVWACDETEERFPPQVDAARYREDMTWKRELHAEHGTVLLEINQTDIWSGNLDAILEQRLGDAGVGPAPSGESEIDLQIDSLMPSAFHPFVDLMGSFLSLYRAGGWERDAVVSRAVTPRNAEFLELFWPFLDFYEQALKAEGKIDFDAMLIQAVRAMSGGYATKRYRYIIVDEYQDTSRARLELIRRLRGDPSRCHLFLVGDDWQSIYRFTGTDVSYFTQVEKHLGSTARVDLRRTFRLTPDVAAASTRFITKNPHQLEKIITPREVDRVRPGISVRFYPKHREQDALRAVLAELRQQEPHDPDILVLARYNYRLAIWNEVRKGLPGAPGCRTLTVHRAKGLEANHVIVLGLDSGTFGFPSEIADDSVLQMLLGAEEAFPNAEERRLFYVALTRTRSRVYLLADAAEPSPFVEELISNEYAEWVELFGEESARYRCPRCHGRTIRRREGRSGFFWGCLHYSACRGRLATCPECQAGVMEPTATGTLVQGYRCSQCPYEANVCPKCTVGALLRREGKYRPFMGCSEWRLDGSGCEYTSGVLGRECGP